MSLWSKWKHLRKKRSVLDNQSFFVQKVKVSERFVGRSRVDVLSQLCSGQSVLHVGCADWPITNVHDSLHVQLDKVCARLDGFDLHEEALDTLRPHVQGKLSTRLGEFSGPYDVVLVPEVIEHVDSVRDFLRDLSSINAGCYIITAPDAFQCSQRFFHYDGEQEEFIEVIHPDHNCWFSPYTLKAVVAKYTDWSIEGIYLLNNISIMLIASRKK